MLGLFANYQFILSAGVPQGTIVSTKFVKTVLTLDGGRSPFGILFQLEPAWRVCKDSSVTMSGAGRNLQGQGRATHADKNEAQEGSESEEAGFYQF